MVWYVLLENELDRIEDMPNGLLIRTSGRTAKEAAEGCVYANYGSDGYTGTVSVYNLEPSGGRMLPWRFEFKNSSVVRKLQVGRNW